jgi:hypothetical protein
LNETEILQAIRLALGARKDVLIFRNNVGALKTRGGQLVRFGVGGRGGSDLIGFVVRPPHAIFLAIEVKVPGAYTEPKHLEDQVRFIRAIRAAGGLAGFARSVQDAEEITRGIIRDY